ncbi:quinone-dependent dihydroorotate dehydrogenase [Candidatus Uhrbacteria bacterium]|nr:quinone-dependent dihydroorotate dehydrogenase [Candidatus Uhrbacteria bacterium]
MIYQRLLRPMLFALSSGDPETAHEWALRLLAWFDATPERRRFLARVAGALDLPKTPRCLFGLTFPTPVGLAAGFDKNAVAPRVFEALGFGFVEIGTVTPRPQPGNPRPRIVRLPPQALINRMGFPSEGADAVAVRLRANSGGLGIPLGVNIGKNKETSLIGAAADYRTAMQKLYERADYFVINVSSPNTPGLRSLQGKEELDWLLGEVAEENLVLAMDFGREPRPVLVKLSPDLSSHAMAEAVEVCVKHGIAGIIAANTTLARDGFSKTEEAGGGSGTPLRPRAAWAVSVLRRYAPSEMAIIGVGGIMCADDARAMREAGADLVQLYTGLIYRGPFLAVAVARGLVERPALAAGLQAAALPPAEKSPPTP